jgi:cytochrome c peroxidase
MRTWFVFLGVLSCVASLAAQAPLAAPAAPPQNPTTAAKAVLGKMLFWDEQLASNGRMACGTCHRPDAGGGDPRRARHPGRDGIAFTLDDTFGSPGIERRLGNGQLVADPAFGTAPQVTPRAAPSVLMAAWFPELFWDGRAGGAFVDPGTQQPVIAQGGALENLVLHPFLDPVEMSRPGRALAELVQRLAEVQPLALASQLPADVQQALASSATYPDLFAAAFGTPAIDPTRIAFALASYLRTLVADQTPWDQHVRNVPNALTANQLAGLALFENEARCHICHPVGLFTDLSFRGLGLVPVGEDPGRGAVTNQSEDFGAFKVPSLRNVALKSTFLHNGRFTTLTQVVGFYRNGGGSNGPRDPELAPLGIDGVETQQLLDFLTNALVDPRVRQGLPPFDRPQLWSERHPIGSNRYGTATPWSGGTPELLADAPAFLANREWSLGVRHGPPGGVALTVLGMAPAPVGATLAGLPLMVSLAAPHGVFAVPLDGTGLGTFALPVPRLPELRGLDFAVQAFLPVPGPALAATGGATIRVP